MFRLKYNYLISHYLYTKQYIRFMKHKHFSTNHINVIMREWYLRKKITLQFFNLTHVRRLIGCVKQPAHGIYMDIKILI